MTRRYAVPAIAITVLFAGVVAYLTPKIRTQVARSRHRTTLGRLVQWSNALAAVRDGLKGEAISGKRREEAILVSCRAGWSLCRDAKFYEARLVGSEVEKATGAGLQPLDAWGNSILLGIAGAEYVAISLGRDNRASPEIGDNYLPSQTDGETVLVNGLLRFGPTGFTRMGP